MADRRLKTALYEEFAAVGKALASPSRLQVLDLLAQGPRSVDDLAAAAGLKLSTCSAHLQVLRAGGLVTAARDGTRVVYDLAGTDVAGLLDTLRRVAQTHRPQTEAALRSYLGSDEVEPISRDELLRRAAGGDVVVLDVRPAAEYAAGHLPGAVHIPLDELPHRLAELPGDRDVVAYCRGAYCVLATEAARLLRRHGRRAARSADGVLEWRLAGIPLATGAA
jgi:rhodanese-related sulfurtransferase